MGFNRYFYGGFFFYCNNSTWSPVYHCPLFYSDNVLITHTHNTQCDNVINFFCERFCNFEQSCNQMNSTCCWKWGLKQTFNFARFRIRTRTNSLHELPKDDPKHPVINKFNFYMLKFIEDVLNFSINLIYTKFVSCDV